MKILESIRNVVHKPVYELIRDTVCCICKFVFYMVFGIPLGILAVIVLYLSSPLAALVALLANPTLKEFKHSMYEWLIGFPKWYFKELFSDDWTTSNW